RRYDRNSGSIVQRNENHIELTYQAQVMPWWVIQPDFQYVWRPGGGVQDYGSSHLRRVRDEAIFGLHSSINF
ncbi:carbohydrate porin, partial [Acetobacter estunensis]